MEKTDAEPAYDYRSETPDNALFYGRTLEMGSFHKRERRSVDA